MGNRKVLVTGGAGYIGSHTVVELFQAGYTPVILDDFSNSDKKTINRINKILNTEVKFFEGDCGNEDYLEKIFLLEKDISGVIHFAASKAVAESVQNPLKYYDNNVGSMISLLKVMNRSDINCLVFSSSCTVYGNSAEQPVRETSPVLPAESPYGNTKHVCEQIIRDFSFSKESFKALSLRYFNPIGAHPSALIGELPIGTPANLVPYISQTAAGIREELTVFGNDYNTPDGTCVRDYIHVIDLAKAHIRALDYIFQNKSAGYDVINCGTGKGNTVLEVIKTFEKVNNLMVNYSIGTRRPGDVEAIYSNVDKAKDLIGWQSSLTLEDALRDAWKWEQTLQK
ncbi:MAG: UDP-glucose 4-epimerase GalE [Bacteroidetes bacterium]|nr:UDP-glucose 4-epimerase GalE [Bacteroidota bacterium]MDA1119351.1 UDP-glucose 4-epimerase GalE [Bacteroidota bacterium]